MPPPVIAAIVSGVTGLVSAKVAANGQSTAADKQAEAIEKGIALQGRMYDQDRADTAGYRALGNGAVGNLAYLSGITPQPDAAPATPPPAAPLSTDTVYQNMGVPPEVVQHFTHGGPLNLYQKVADKTTAAYNKELLASGGQTTKVTRNGVTRIIPKSMLDKARGDGFQEVVQ